MDLSIRVIALMLCRDRSHFASKHPHLSVVQIFKDHRCAKPKSPSAAQKRDYEPLPLFLSSSSAFISEPPDSPVTAETATTAGEVRILRI